MEATEIKTIMEGVLDEKLKGLKVDAEKHQSHHEWLQSWIDLTADIKSTFLKSLVRAFVGGMIILLVLGFAVWGGKH